MTDNASDPKGTSADLQSADLQSAYPHVMADLPSAAAQPRTIRSLCERSHAIAKSKGWLDDKRSTASLMLLFVSEVIEGFEDYRSNRGTAEIYFEGPKPCGIPIELADVVIRVCQHAGTEGIADDLAQDLDLEHLDTAGRSGDIETFLADLCKHFVDFRELMNADERGDASRELADAVGETFEFAALFGVDLWAAIEMKEEYNRTRPMRHGGKRC